MKKFILALILLIASNSFAADELSSYSTTRYTWFKANGYNESVISAQIVPSPGGCSSNCTFNGTTTLGGQITWSIGLGGIQNLRAATDQHLRLSGGSNSIILTGANTQFLSQTLFGSGLGAITHILGPSDQALKATSNDGSTNAQVSLSNGGATLAYSNNSFVVAGSSSGTKINSIIIQQWQRGGFTLSSGDQPTVTSCGTGIVTTGSTNNAGEVTATGATTCSVVFTQTPFATIAFCTVTDETTAAALGISAIAPTGFTVTNLTSGDKFMWFCGGK